MFIRKNESSHICLFAMNPPIVFQQAASFQRNVSSMTEVNQTLPLNSNLCLSHSYHVLHTDTDLAIAVEGPVEAHDVGRVTLMEHLQLSDYLVPDGRLNLQVDELWSREIR